MYDISCVFRNITRNKKIYLLILLELVLCFTMMMIGINEKVAYSNRKAIHEKETTERLATISDEKGSYLFSFDANQFDEENLPSDVVYANVYMLNYITPAEKVKTVRLISGNEYFYRHYFGFSLEDGQCYVSQVFKDDWNDSNVFLEQGIQIRENKFAFHPLELEVSVIKENIIIPIDVYEKNDINTNHPVVFIKESVASNLPIAKIGTVIKVHDNGKAKELIKSLEPYNKSPLHKINLEADFEKGSNSLSAFVRLFGWVSFIAMIVVTFGTSGIVIVFLEKRKKSYAIQYCFGASELRLKLQLFFEILAVMVAAIVISALLSLILETKISSIYYSVKLELISVALVAFLGMVAALIILMLSGIGNTLKHVSQWMK